MENIERVWDGVNLECPVCEGKVNPDTLSSHDDYICQDCGLIMLSDQVVVKDASYEDLLENGWECFED